MWPFWTCQCKQIQGIKYSSTILLRPFNSSFRLSSILLLLILSFIVAAPIIQFILRLSSILLLLILSFIVAAPIIQFILSYLIHPSPSHPVLYSSCSDYLIHPSSFIYPFLLLLILSFIVAPPIIQFILSYLIHPSPSHPVIYSSSSDYSIHPFLSHPSFSFPSFLILKIIRLFNSS